MTPQQLAQLEEHRIAEAVADVALASIRLEGGGTVCWGGDGSWMNEGRGLAMRGEVPPGEVDRAIGFLRERGAGVRFDVCPYAYPSIRQVRHHDAKQRADGRSARALGGFDSLR